jgi:hypothetical protein
MSLSTARPPVYLEIPNFGYGPASAALAVIAPVASQYSWHIVSSGEAGDFVASQLPGATRHELDTNYPEQWDGFLTMVPPGSAVVSFTNPEFGAWAAQRGYRVGVVDTLDWMWGATLPATIPGAEFYLVQDYFAVPSGAVSEQREIVRPLVDQALWGGPPRPAQPGTAMIGFGGMHVPFENEVVAEYIRWMLSAVLPVLIGQAGVTQLTIVGGRADLAGLVPGYWAKHPAVRVHTGLERTRYAALARRSEHVAISPGLAHVYECAVAGLAPLIQPGFSMSMVLQAHHVALTGYPHMYNWPWLAEAESKITGMSEPDGMRYVNELMLATMHDDARGQDFAKAVTSYLEREPGDRLRLPLEPGRPHGAELVAAHLARLTGR